MDKKGKLISIEGIDYTGKTTISKRLSAELGKQGVAANLTCEPPLIKPWRDLKEFFETQVEVRKLSEAMLLLSARLDNYERIIKPSVARCDILITDRYIDSWFAYQSYRLRGYFSDSVDEALNFLLEVNELLIGCRFLSWPDLTILIIDEPGEILKRATSRSRTSKYEEIETQKAVQEIYLKLADRFRSRVKVCDARGKNLEAVFNEVYTMACRVLEGHHGQQAL